jgi:hypothetical protein
LTGEFQFDPFLSTFLSAHLNKRGSFEDIGVDVRVILKKNIKEIGLEYVY